MNISERQMVDLLSRGWWVLLLRGLIAIAFGLLALFQPGITLTALILLFGVYVLADGILGVWSGIAGRKDNRHWWLLLLGGVISIAVGILTFIAPAATAFVLLLYIAFWAIFTGVVQVSAAIRLRKEIQGEWVLILAGAVSVVFGVLLVIWPEAGALSLLWLIGLYTLVLGILNILLAFRVRSGSKDKELLP